MKTLVKRMHSFLRSEGGPTVTEYAVMLALIIAVCIAGISLIGDKVESIFTTITGGLPTGS